MFRHTVRPDVEMRILQEHHAEELFALTDRNRHYLRQWLPWLDSVRSPDDTAAFIRNTLEQFAANNGFTAGIWCGPRIAGVIGLHRIDWLNRRTEIGYWVSSDRQGRGLVTDCCRDLVTHVFEDIGLHRVEIRCATGNTRSCAIPERLGFTREGVAREAEWLYDRHVDLVVYSMLAREWPAGQPSRSRTA